MHEEGGAGKGGKGKTEGRKEGGRERGGGGGGARYEKICPREQLRAIQDQVQSGSVRVRVIFFFSFSFIVRPSLLQISSQIFSNTPYKYLPKFFED